MRTYRPKFYRLVYTLLGLAILGGCMLPAAHVIISPHAQLSEIKTVAVWRFRDGGSIANSGDIATTAVESTFMGKGFRLVSYSKIRDILSIEIGYREGMSLDAGMLTPRVLSRIREETGVDAIILGSVSDAWCNMLWIPPCWIECSFKMFDARSGEIIISANVSDDGYSIQSAAQQMAEKAVSKLR